MGVLNSELEAARDAAIQRFVDNITTIEVGDNGTGFNPTQTGVISSIGSTTYEELDQSTLGELIYSGKFGISSFVGSTVREVSLTDGINSKTRDLTVEAVKGSDQIFWFNIKVKARAINSNF